MKLCLHKICLIQINSSKALQHDIIFYKGLYNNKIHTQFCLLLYTFDCLASIPLSLILSFFFVFHKILKDNITIILFWKMIHKQIMYY